MPRNTKRPRIEIPEAVAQAAAVPEDLDAAQRAPYTIPSTRRRRVAGWIHVGGAATAAGLVAMGAAPGLLVAAAVLAVIGMWSLAAAWPIRVLDPQALDIAGAAVGFAVGHASAAVSFDGWRSRPVWNVLVFSGDEPPTRRGLVRVDAVDGHVVEKYEEEVAAAESRSAG
ncbi:MAG: hypothetical protein HZA58_09290 [Acidimicrobiia bacterium]|nr:hypothetical protein [Acidimicrobiia bacterium]